MGLIFFAFFEKFFVPILTSGGYVGLSIATLLSQHHQVTAVDIVPEKVDLINNRKSPIQDDYIEKYLAEKELNLTATLDAKAAYADADFVVIAAPTNVYSKEKELEEWLRGLDGMDRLVDDYVGDKIPLWEKIMDRQGTVCCAWEKTAFEEGLKVGMRLMMEVYSL